MKRFANLWDQIIQFANLLEAARKAQKGKRYRENILAFNYNREAELLDLQATLRAQTYCPGAYRTFEIVEPKRRLISAAPYRDRVVHHALCNVVVPLVEPSFIYDSYANRVGKGSHRALERFTRFARSIRYVDDFALFSDDQGFLQEARQAIEANLAALRLKIHPVKSQLFETRHGANFLGFRVHPIGDTFPRQVYIRVRTENLRRTRRRLRRLQTDYAIGQRSLKELLQSLQGWEAHLKHGDTWQLRQQIFTSLKFIRG